MRIASNVLSGFRTVRELLSFMWQQRLWWLIPFVVAILMMGMVILAGQASGVSPFIYTIF